MRSTCGKSQLEIWSKFCTERKVNYCWTWFGIRCNHHQHQLWSSVEIWAQNQVENWCAFAPDFKEFDKNVEYEERESEIDIEDKDKSVDLSTETKHDEEIEVDVSKVDPIAAFCNSDEELDEEQCLQYIPMAPEVEEPDGWNSQDNSNDPDTGSNDADTDSAGPSSSKRRRTQTQTYDIQLEGVPAEELYPLLQCRSTKEKQCTTGKKTAGCPRK